MKKGFFGASLLALAIASPALAQTGSGSGLDTIIDDQPAPSAPPASTGDPVLDRLNALEAKIAALEARNKQLEEQAAETTTRVEKVEVRAAKGVQPGVAPTFADVGGNFSFKPRGTLQVDYAGLNERAGGYDYNNGTDLRRARFGFDGTSTRTSNIGSKPNM
jgi:phosphate-selective porin OprO/OprP